MNSIIYKVLFKGSQNGNDEPLNLTFGAIESEDIIKVPPELINILKSNSKGRNSQINFQNIEEVLVLNVSKPQNYNYFIVLLHSLKHSGEKGGYLIANKKGIGDHLVGIWPFNAKKLESLEEKIQETLEKMMNVPNDFNEIVLITQ